MDSVFALFGTATINVAEELGDGYEESYDVTFKWYRDAVLMEDVTGDTYTFKNTDGDAKFAVIMTATDKETETETTYYTSVITCGKEIGVVRVTIEDLIAGMDSRNLIDSDLIDSAENQTFITIEGGYARGFDLLYYEGTSRLQYSKHYVEANTKYAFLILIYPTSGFSFDDNVKVVLSEKITFKEFGAKDSGYIRLYVDVNAIDDYDFQTFYTTDSTENVGQGDYLKLDIEKMKTESADFATAYEAGKVTYQWYANDKVIEGATSDKYQIGKDDAGKEISVAVNADGKYSVSSKIEATKVMSLDITVTDLYVGSILTTENVTEKNGKVEIVSIYATPGGDTLQNQSTSMRIVVRPANGYTFPVMTNELFTTLESAIKVNGNAIMGISGILLGVAPTEINIFYQFTPETHVHNAVKQDGKAAGCTENGWKEYYKCDECLKYFSDSACTVEITDLAAWKTGAGKIPAAHTSTEFTYTTNNDGTHTKKHACCGTLVGNENCSGGSATCTTKATCEKCNTAYGDFGAHDFTGVTLTEEIPATCVATGTKAHKDCSVCEKHFAADGVTEIANLTLPIDSTNHDMATEWTGVADGHYHKCKRAGCEYHDTLVGHSSSGAATEQNAETCTVCQYIITPALGHTTCSGGIKQNGQAATCTVNGWNDYYKCSGCEKLYEDAACTILISDFATWKIGDGKIVASHTYGELVVQVDAKHTATELVAGKKAHYFCDVCDTYFTSEKVATTEAELVISAPTHTPRADDGDCTTDILCTGCDKVMIEGADAHADTDTNGKCDTCGKDMPTTPGGDEPGTDTPGTDEPGTDTPGTDDPNTGNIDEPKDDEGGLGTGAIAGIVVGSVAVLGLGGFALIWFVIKKKTWAEFLAIFKKK